MIRKGKHPLTVNNLDLIPFPAHHLIKKYDYGYHLRFKLLKGKFTSMLTSRGCPFRCRFCSRELFGGRRYRKRSAENVLKEIEYVHDLGYNGIIFVEDNFLIDKNRTMDIMKRIIERGLKLNIMIERSKNRLYRRKSM